MREAEVYAVPLALRLGGTAGVLGVTKGFGKVGMVPSF